MSTKITSPIEGFDGKTVFGPLSVEFKDGVAETDEKVTPGLRAYLKTRGYKVGKSTDTEAKTADPTDAEKAEAAAQAEKEAVEAAEKTAAETAAAEKATAEQKGGQKNGR